MIHHTINDTTTYCGESIATVIADSVSAEGQRITTLELVYPRFILPQFNTHRVFSRNSASSRATPLSVTLKEVYDDPVHFEEVGKNQSGMISGELLSREELDSFHTHHEALGVIVASYVERMSKELNVHKQVLNRYLEPWLRIRTLVTATDWDNFFKLRLADDAQAEIQSLATAMKFAMEKSEPKEGWGAHLPYITEEDLESNPSVYWFKVAVARCARISYSRLDGRENNYDDDMKLYERLKESGHLTPFEHIAYPRGCCDRYANLTGWQSLRNLIEN